MRGTRGEAGGGKPEEMSIAPPMWSVSWDVFAWMGHRRFARHWSVPQIRSELKDRFAIDVSADLVEDYVAKYEIMVAARESDVERLVEEYRDVPDVLLTIDGLQPEKGHETLYVVRELRARQHHGHRHLARPAGPGLAENLQPVMPGARCPPGRARYA